MQRARLRAAAGAARAAGPQGGAPRPDPAPGGRGVGSRVPQRVSTQPGARTHGQSRGADPQAGSLALDLVPDIFAMRVLLEETGEMFQVTNCRGDMTVRELKEELDLIAGIPLNLQQLQYLDQGALVDDSTLNSHDVVPGGIISLCVWHYDGWTDLVSAAVEGDTSKLSCLGVAEESPCQSANAQYLGEKHWKAWVAQRAFVALYIASHRGRVEAVLYLLEHGANCHGRSPMGRTPLHVATAMGQSDCITPLLRYGASVHTKDAKGMTPQAIARQLNHRQDERQMFLSYWMAKSRRKDLKDLNLNKAFQSGKFGSGSKK
ncbi:ankyrin repeat domain-containing protein 60 [Pteronotus mesoamericanus]|uniref:ankyrin repeat domain-containing protein 60 n=1 Tax=Pteronotus mesoamericanus TaxID=1884717 RepID=UPI0023ED4C1B|nr:ankyrin repeat domain-containing protein 60 [Pteronotus parnellii mesoamericanus]